MKEVIYLELVRRWAYWLLALATLVAFPGLSKAEETTSFSVFPDEAESAMVLEPSRSNLVRACNSTAGGRKLRDRAEPARSSQRIPPVCGGILNQGSSRTVVQLGFDPGDPAAPRRLVERTSCPPYSGE